MMEEGKQQLMESLSQAPPEVIDCLASLLGAEMVEKMKAGTAMPSREIGDQMGQCFGQMGPPPGEGGPGEGGMMPPAGQTGPGGCQSQEECRSYCESHPEECQNFQPPAMNNPSPEGNYPPPKGIHTAPGGGSIPE